MEGKRIAMVRAVDAEPSRFYVELRDGTFSRQDFPLPPGLKNGSHIFVSSDGTIEEAPAELWTETPLVGVVRKKADGYSILTTGGRLVHVPDRGDYPYEEGNTVLAHEATGVYRVVDQASLLEDAKQLRPSTPLPNDEHLTDFGGYSEIVSQVREFVANAFGGLGDLTEGNIRPPRGALFSGDPGTGKTKLARIIANEAQASYFPIRGPELHSKWIGESAQKVREVFDAAERTPKALIVFDEIDGAVGRRTDVSHDEKNQIVTEVLARMDGLQNQGNVVVIGTTNKVDNVDEALRRPGRLDLEIHFPLPILSDRVDILTKSAPNGASPRLPIDVVASQTDGWSGAELADVWTQAAITSRSYGHSSIRIDDFLRGFQRAASAFVIRHSRSALS